MMQTKGIPEINEVQKKNDIFFKNANNTETFVTINQTEANKFLAGLAESLSEIDSFKEYVSNTLVIKLKEIEAFENSTIKMFNSLVDNTRELSEKIQIAGNYEDYLKEQLENAELTKQISILELHLNKERSEINLVLNKISEDVENSISIMQSKISELKVANDIIEQSIQHYSQETEDSFKSYTEKAEQTLEKIASNVMEISQGHQEALRIKCDTFLDDYTKKCIKHLETVKNQSIDFLKQCEDENKKLIKKVPEISNKKISIKDMIIYAIATITIIGLFVNLIS